MNLFARRDFIFISTLLFATALYAADPLPKVPTVDQAIIEATKEAPLRWKFAGNTPEDLASWQRQFRTKLGELLGPHTPPKTFSSKRIGLIATGKHIREEWLLKAKGTPTLPLYLLRPKNNGPHPIILALHGHGQFGHDAMVGINHTEERRANIAKANYDYGRVLTAVFWWLRPACYPSVAV